MAYARLGVLSDRLVAAKVALRSRVRAAADEGRRGPHAHGHTDGRTHGHAHGHTHGGGDDDDSYGAWAATAAGVRLSQPTPLTSVYGLHSRPTHAVPGYANTLDWVCVDATQLRVDGVAPLPPLEALTRHVAMPSVEWPSDHVSLCCDLSWRDDDAGGRRGGDSSGEVFGGVATGSSAGHAPQEEEQEPSSAERRRPTGSSWVWRT